MDSHQHFVHVASPLFEEGPIEAYYVTIGRGTSISHQYMTEMISFVDEAGWNVSIGSFVSVAQKVTVLLSLKGGGHMYEYLSTYKFDALRAQLFPGEFEYAVVEGKRTVEIGSDVWIGYGAKIINSVTLGHGCVIGAYSVVREDVPPYAIVVGNPAKIVKYRFNESEIDFLLGFKWWDLPDEDILFRMPSRDKFSEFYEWAIRYESVKMK